MATLETILGHTKRFFKNSLLSIVGTGIALFGYGKLYAANPIQPTYRNLDVKTEQLESGLEAIVVAGMYASWYDDVSIIVDTENNPHIIYKNNNYNLELADINDGQWRAITISEGGTGGWNSIVMDKEGYFHISSSESDGANESLLYFTNKDGWKRHLVDNGLSVGLENDIALDNNGKVHISHWQWNGSRLLYSTNKNGEWETSILDEDAYWTPTSIAIDANDKVYISYSANKLGILNNVIREWTQQELLDASGSMRLIMDDNDIIHIVFKDFTNLIYLTNKDEWQPHIVSRWGGHLMNRKGFQDNSSIALDPNGLVHIAAIAGENSIIDEESLLYLTNKFGEWKEFLIDRSLGCHNPAISADSEGNIHIAYSEDIGVENWAGYNTIRNVKYVKFDPSKLSLPYKLITGLCYGPYREGQDPTLGIHPSIDDLTEDLSFISKLTPNIMIYGIDNNLFNIPKLSYNKGLNCFVGVFLSGDPLLNEQAIENALNLARQENYSLRAIIVGNETILRGDLTATESAAYINDLRQRIKEDDPFINPWSWYITTADAWSVWLNNPELVDAADIIMANVHPYREGISIEDAASYVVDKYNELDAAYNKPIVISETGWPSEGETIGNAVPSPENQRKFLLDFRKLAGENKIPYFYFESYDEPWKAQYEGEAGRHWGLVDSEGNIKPSLQAILPAGFR